MLAETPYARCSVHTVAPEGWSGTTGDGNGDGTTDERGTAAAAAAAEAAVVNDWIFLEERSAVNVAVRMAAGGGGGGGRFVLFRQEKYAIPGPTLAPVGGFVEDGESPFLAARREVFEELGVGSVATLEAVRRSEEEEEAATGGGGNDDDDDASSSPSSSSPSWWIPAPASSLQIPGGALDGYGIPTGVIDDDAEEDGGQWTYLGRYRTMANRGGGFVYSYLLDGAVAVREGGGTGDGGGEGGGMYQGRVGDGEAQEVLHLDEAEVEAALLGGEFQEVKWAATMSLALMHLRIR